MGRVRVGLARFQCFLGEYLSVRMFGGLLLGRVASRTLLSAAPAVLALGWGRDELGVLAAAMGQFVFVGPLIASGPEKATAKLVARSPGSAATVGGAGVRVAAVFAAASCAWLVVVLALADARLPSLLAFVFTALLAVNQTLLALHRAQRRPHTDLVCHLVLASGILGGIVVGLVTDDVLATLATWVVAAAVVDVVAVTAARRHRLTARPDRRVTSRVLGEAVRLSTGDVSAGLAVTVVFVVMTATRSAAEVADLSIAFGLLTVLMAGISMALRLIQAPLAAAWTGTTPDRAAAAPVPGWSRRRRRAFVGAVAAVSACCPLAPLVGVGHLPATLLAVALASPLLAVAAGVHFALENRDPAALRRTNLGCLAALVVTVALLVPLVHALGGPGAVLAIVVGDVTHLGVLRVLTDRGTRPERGVALRRLAVLRRPWRVEVRTRAAMTAVGDRAARPGPAGAAGVARILRRDGGAPHWAVEYAARLVARVPASRPVVIQTSMSPTGPFHIGNFRDTVTAFAVQRALHLMGRSATLLLSFDDYDPVRRTLDGPSSPRRRDESRPLADAPGSDARCRAYVGELQRVGVWPREVDADGSPPSGHGWRVHHQAERYRSGEYLAAQRRAVARRRHVARLLGRADPDRLFRAYCRRCGRNTTDLEALGPRGFTYTCGTCGTREHTHDLTVLKPAWVLDWILRVDHEGIDCEPAGTDHCAAGSTMDVTYPVFERLLKRPQPVIVPYGLVRQHDADRRVSGSSGDGLVVGDLLDVMPPEMVLWLYLRTDVRRDIRIAPDLAHLARWYAEWDAFVASARRGEPAASLLWRLISDDEPPAGPAPPGFRRCAGLLQSSFYDVDAAAARSGVADVRTRRRLSAARAWLLRWGHRHSWLHQVHRPTGALAWDRRLEDPRRLGEAFPAAGYHAAAWALWGTTHAPPLSRAVEHFGARAVADALRAFRCSGRRPLRDALTATWAGAPGVEVPRGRSVEVDGTHDRAAARRVEDRAVAV